MTAAAVSQSIALIPDRAGRHGPITLALRRRLLGAYAVACCSGLGVALLGSPAWQGFGLGLLFPGAGFLTGCTSLGSGLAALGAVTLSLLVFGLGFLAWFGTGNIVAPVVAWLGAALVATLLAPAQPWPAAPLAAAAVVALAALVLRLRAARTHAVEVANRSRRNQHLAQRATTFVPAEARGEVRPLSDDALLLLRHVLDRGLAPVEDFSALHYADQFQFGALRYALCFMGYALAGVQHGATPAFSGYLDEAQRRVHRKMLDHRNWRYWALENAWGNLALDPNPIHHRDNVMYHGWFMAMLGEYISNTGDERYNQEPLVLRHPSGREWRYTFSEICEVLFRCHRDSEFTLFPCEPNWIYPICNNFSAIALKIHDRLYGTDWFEQIRADYRRHFDEEFCTVDGRVLAIRSRYTGITLPMLTSAMADSVTAFFQHGTFPDIARRSWEIARMDYIRVAQGQVDIEVHGWDKLDTGNYRPSLITTYAQIGAAAAEMGDDEVATLLQRRVRDEFSWDTQDGAVTLRGVSTQGHAAALYHFTGHAGLRRRIHARGADPVQRSGPRLASAPYPDVLVSYAVSDGTALDLELCPGRPSAAGAQHTLQLGQLRPNAGYRLADGTRIESDARGTAPLQVRLHGRTRLHLVPEA